MTLSGPASGAVGAAMVRGAPVRAVGAVLVHGAWHDGSCWAPVVSRLEGLGLPARAVDLPTDRPGASTTACVASVVSAARELGAGPGAPVVLVGHSLGGLVIPVVAQELGPAAVAALVLVGALVPAPGRSWIERLRAEPSAMVPGFDVGQERRPDRTTVLPAVAAARGLYAGVAEESSAHAVAEAVARLRPQDWSLVKEPCPLVAWPPVHTVSVVCGADRVVDPAWSRGAGAVPGAEVVELPGGHFPMLTRPHPVAEVIVAAAGRGSR